MSWTNRVVWQEGMFLRTQHFQQQDRWVEALVQGRAGMLRPYPWGLTAFAIDRALLATGWAIYAASYFLFAEARTAVPTLAVFALYGVAAALMRDHVLGRPRVVAWMRRTFAAAFVGLGVKLALTER